MTASPYLGFVYAACATEYAVYGVIENGNKLINEWLWSEDGIAENSNVGAGQTAIEDVSMLNNSTISEDTATAGCVSKFARAVAG